MAARRVLTAVSLSVYSLLVIGATSTLPPPHQHVLVLDVDGTLYEDDCAIETQIRDNCHKFSLERYGFDADQSEAMHREWGATIRGIVESGHPRFQTYTTYYNEVYPHLDMSRLRKYSSIRIEVETESETEITTGYTHHNRDEHKRATLQALYRIAVRYPIVVASNSPVFHVQRVLSRLGLARLPVAAFITPERRGGVIKTEAKFWDPLFALFPKGRFQCTLVDDNALNVKLARELGMTALRIEQGNTLRESLVSFLHAGKLPTDLNDSDYLEAKNAIDLKSLNEEVLKSLVSELSHQTRGKETAAIVDLGAGTLSMLPVLLSSLTEVAGTEDSQLKRVTYIAFESNTALKSATVERLAKLGLSATTAPSSSCQTYAGETAGLSITVHVLALDFMSTEAIKAVRALLPSKCAKATTYTPSFAGLDLCVGCCVADLISPASLCSQLVELAGDKGGLIYLPITFAGKTQLHRGRACSELQRRMDERVLSDYHLSLEETGHYLEPAKLAHSLADYGCDVLHNGAETPSPWHIRQDRDAYMFACMKRFIAHGTTLRLLGSDIDVPTWLSTLSSQSQNEESPPLTFEVSNVDILARLPSIEQVIQLGGPATPGGSTIFQDMPQDHLASTPPFVRSNARFAPSNAPTMSPHSQASSMPPTLTEISNADAPVKATALRRHMIEFSAPRSVRVVEEACPVLRPGQVLIKAICSLVSTGTELKVFRGDFDSNQPQDLTISGFADNSLRFPLTYGYSLVGTVVDTDDSPSSQQWLGKRVFAFCPHGDMAVADVSSLLLVPDDISSEDAVFLPSVETALALVMEARPAVGERVCVVGQGLIGLLVGAVVGLAVPGAPLTVADVSPARLGLAERLNPQAKLWNPSQSASAEQELDFDVTLEVSGHGGGLQTAIDSTGRGGRIILGSLYGENLVPLHVGLAFHRSGLRLQASQVSNIPPDLRDRWTKDRRFSVAWDLLKKLRVSESLLSSPEQRVSLDSAAVQTAYERLEQGKEVTALFRY